MALWCAIRRATSIAVPLTNRGRFPAISKRFYSPKEMDLCELVREINSKLKDKSQGRPPRRMGYAPPQSEDDEIITDDYLLQLLPPGTKFDFEGVRKVLYKIRHPFEDPYLQLPRWAIDDDDDGDDDQDDFDRLLDQVIADMEDDEEPHTHES